MQCITGADHSFQVFDCVTNNKLKGVACIFDQRIQERCSFPLEVNIDRFGTEKHILDAYFVDEFWQIKLVSFEFQLAERKCITNTKNLVLNYYNLHSNG